MMTTKQDLIEIFDGVKNWDWGNGASFEGLIEFINDNYCYYGCKDTWIKEKIAEEHDVFVTNVDVDSNSASFIQDETEEYLTDSAFQYYVDLYKQSFIDEYIASLS